MTVQFRDAVRQNIHLLLGVIGGTGSGKTYSALRMARGLAEGKPIVAIDTENGRLLHYADQFEFKYAELVAPFRPERYAEAVEEAAKLEPGVILVDSTSHSWAGDGGMLDWHDELMRGDERRKMTAWIEPKRSHARMVTRLLAVPCHVILCFRAEPKVDIVRDANGRMEIVPKRTLTGLDGWIPICDKNLPFELTASFLLMADAPGVPRPIKLEEQHRAFVPLDAKLDETVGASFAQWARGESAGRPAKPAEAEPATTEPATSEPGTPAGATVDPTADQIAELDSLVGRLIAASKIRPRQLWGNVAKARGIAIEPMRDLLDEGSSEFRWDPLRESLTADEAVRMIDRLSKLEAKT